MWARIAAYAAVGFAAACLWLFLGSSPASADDARPGLLDSVGSLTTAATEPVTDLTRQTLQQVGDVEQRTTETVRQVAAQTGVRPVRDVVDQTTLSVDQVVHDTVADTTDEPESQPQPEPQPDRPDAGLVERAQQLRSEIPASSGSATRARAASHHHPPVVAFQAPTTSPQVSAPVAALVPETAPAEHRPTPDLGASPDGTPDGTAPTGAGSSGALAALPTTLLRLPQTAAVTVTDVRRQAPRPPVSSPGFSPD